MSNEQERPLPILDHLYGMMVFTYWEMKIFIGVFGWMTIFR